MLAINRRVGRHRTAAILAILTAVGIASLYAGAVADDEPQAGGESKAADLSQQKMRAYGKLVARFTLTPSRQQAKPLQLQTTPLLKWSNPLRAAPYGAAYLWTDDGHPAVVACIYEWTDAPTPLLTREFHSLRQSSRDVAADMTDVSSSIKPSGLPNNPAPAASVEARYGEEKPFWSPRKQGIEFKPIPGTAEKRRSGSVSLQARRLSRRFRARLLHLMDEKNFELRSLPRALYEYDDVSGKRYSALFGFVQGTDPEVLVLLERRADGDRSVWNYAVARMTSGALEVRIDDQVVWAAEEIPGEILADPARPYAVFWDTSIQLPTESEPQTPESVCK